jgi:hypothetical protein
LQPRKLTENVATAGTINACDARRSRSVRRRAPTDRGVERRQVAREPLADPSVLYECRVAKPLDERPCHGGLNRGHQPQPEGRQPRREKWHLDDHRPPPEHDGDSLHQFAVRHHLRAAYVELLRVGTFEAADTDEIAHDVLDCHRLGLDGDPTRTDHPGQATDESDYGLERGASRADDHRGAEPRDGNVAALKAHARLGATPEVRRERRRVVA